jgi:hypothetical protein
MRGIRTAAATFGEMSTVDWLLPHAERARHALHVEQQSDEPFPAWFPEAVERIVHLADAPTLDPATSRPLNIEDAGDALVFMGRVMDEDTCLPWIGRLSSGGIELAWTHGDVEVEAVFDRLRGDRELIVTVGENEWDAPADEGYSLFATVVDRLSNSYIDHTAGAPAAASAA